MRQKTGLDNCALNSFFFQEKDFQENKAKKALRKKVSNFNDSCIKCKNFEWKKESLKTQMYWCKETNNSCTYRNCPKNKTKQVEQD